MDIDKQKNTEAFNEKFWAILHEENQKIRALLSQAIKEGVHVDILVESEPGKVLAWEYFESIGFSKGASPFTHVLHPSESAEDGHHHMRVRLEKIIR